MRLIYWWTSFDVKKKMYPLPNFLELNTIAIYIKTFYRYTFIQRININVWNLVVIDIINHLWGLCISSVYSLGITKLPGSQSVRSHKCPNRSFSFRRIMFNSGKRSSVKSILISISKMYFYNINNIKSLCRKRKMYLCILKFLNVNNYDC